MDKFMLILGLVMLLFTIYFPLKHAGTTDPKKQGIIFGYIFGIGVSISIIIQSLNNIL
jgi:hypothetical protein